MAEMIDIGQGSAAGSDAHCAVQLRPGSSKSLLFILFL